MSFFSFACLAVSGEEVTHFVQARIDGKTHTISLSSEEVANFANDLWINDFGDKKPISHIDAFRLAKDELLRLSMEQNLGDFINQWVVLDFKFYKRWPNVAKVYEVNFALRGRFIDTRKVNSSRATIVISKYGKVLRFNAL